MLLLSHFRTTLAFWKVRVICNGLRVDCPTSIVIDEPRLIRLVAISRIDPVELANNRVETDFGEMLVADPLRDLHRSFDNIVWRQHQLSVARLRCNLNLATALEIVHQDKRLGDASAVSVP